MILVLRRACRDAHDGRVGSCSHCAVASGGSPKGVSQGAGGSCLAACRAACAVPLRREVPQRTCLEAQEGHAWLPVKLLALCHCVGRFPKGRVPRRQRVVLGCLLSCLRCAVALGGSPKGVSLGARGSCLAACCACPLRCLNFKSSRAY